MNDACFLAHYRESDGACQSLEDHLEETARFAKRFAGKIGLDFIGEILGLLHDMGKYGSEFQRYLKSAVGLLHPGDKDYLDPGKYRGRIDHSTAGAQLIWETFRDQIKVGRIMAEILPLCLVSHHSGLIDMFSISGEDKFSVRLAKDSHETHLPEVRAKVSKTVLARIDEFSRAGVGADQFKKQVAIIYGLSKGLTFQFSMGLLARFLFSCLVDADRLSTADFECPEGAQLRYLGDYPDWQKLIDCFERVSFEARNDVDRLRNDVSLSCMRRALDGKGLYYLTVPTGGGKTLSSLRFALYHAKNHGFDRIIYVLPYTTIIDQNASRVAEIFSPFSREIVLEHHSNLVPEKDTWRNRILSENWDAPIVFTTSVQLLEALFGGGTRSVRRMHQLARSIIIFDEIQTLPVKAVHLFNNAINFLTNICSSTVVFCTATQPLLHGVDPCKGAAPYSESMEIVDYPALFKALKRVDVRDCVKNGGWTDDDLIGKVRAHFDEIGSVLVVTNTKSSAKRFYESCLDLPGNVFHLSTSMCPMHRKDVLKNVHRCLDPLRPEPVICISTQLIEAGVDVDFGVVVRCLAGLDSIAQAAGRCNRNGLRDIGIVEIVNLRDENLDRLPEIRVAQDVTLRVLNEFKRAPGDFDEDLIGPKAMRRFYEYYFYKRADEMSYGLSARELGRDDDLLTLLSTNHLSIEEYKRRHMSPELYTRQSFMTAGEHFQVIDAPTEAILVQYDDEARSIIGGLSAGLPIGEESELLRRAQQYCVNLFPQTISALRGKGALFQTHEGSEMWYLDERYYSKAFGVSLEPVCELKFLSA
ncbi:MAG: CRISPR-associated helicase Cas3' [Syntrophobacteraceae bacterium]